jgi:hypothetical protein
MRNNILDNYGNYFDVIDTMKTIAFGDNPKSNLCLSFANSTLDYVLEYFYCSNEVYIDGEVDNEYWNDDRVKAIEKRLLETDSEDDDKVDLEAAIDIIFEEMANYSRYVMGE